MARVNATKVAVAADGVDAGGGNHLFPLFYELSVPPEW